jgi:carboxyl-terminal processing protease
MRSRLGTVKIGDVIEAIDGTPTQAYFEQRREYISGSSERDVATSFFDTPVLFPQRFTLTLDGGRQVVVDRQQDVKRPQANTTQGRWLVAGSVGYIKVPTFRTIEAQSTALEYLREFRGARAVILDLRGNMGGDGGVALQRALFDKPYPLWTVTSAVAGGFLLREYDVAYPQGAHLSTSDAKVLPRGTVFSGRLLLLVDRGCSCACEDFVMPFKVTGRATLVGETTAGTFSFTNFTQFENGMMLNLASIRHTFPDGSRFEGIGIAPDVEVHASVSDLKAGNDPALDRALQLAGQPPAATH